MRQQKWVWVGLVLLLLLWPVGCGRPSGHEERAPVASPPSPSASGSEGLPLSGPASTDGANVSGQPPATAPAQPNTTEDHAPPNLTSPTPSEVAREQQPVVTAAEPWSRAAFELGLQMGSTFSLIDARVWLTRALGAEIIVGAVVVPFQVTGRGVWRVLEADAASLSIAPGVTWREGCLTPHVSLCADWVMWSSLHFSFELGVAYALAGGWMPPGPVPFIGLGLPLYTIASVGLRVELPWR